jgi:hypothetical protein
MSQFLKIRGLKLRKWKQGDQSYGFSEIKRPKPYLNLQKSRKKKYKLLFILIDTSSNLYH